MPAPSTASAKECAHPSALPSRWPCQSTICDGTRPFMLDFKRAEASAWFDVVSDIKSCASALSAVSRSLLDTCAGRQADRRKAHGGGLWRRRHRGAHDRDALRGRQDPPPAAAGHQQGCPLVQGPPPLVVPRSCPCGKFRKSSVFKNCSALPALGPKTPRVERLFEVTTCVKTDAGHALAKELGSLWCVEAESLDA